MTSVVTRSTVRRITSRDCGGGASTPSGFCGFCGGFCADRLEPRPARASATKYLRMVVHYSVECATAPELPAAPPPLRIAADDGAKALEDGFILLERHSDLIHGQPAVRV